MSMSLSFSRCRSQELARGGRRRRVVGLPNGGGEDGDDGGDGDSGGGGDVVTAVDSVCMAPH
jgi:hypothetical protein